MSKENRKMMYDKLCKEDRLSQDDGALRKEFGLPMNRVPKPPTPIPKIEKKKGKKDGK